MRARKAKGGSGWIGTPRPRRGPRRLDQPDSRSHPVQMCQRGMRVAAEACLEIYKSRQGTHFVY